MGTFWKPETPKNGPQELQDEPKDLPRTPQDPPSGTKRRQSGPQGSKSDRQGLHGPQRPLEKKENITKDNQNLLTVWTYSPETLVPSTNKIAKQETLTRKFKKLLLRVELLKAEFVNDRTLYRLKHTYATRRVFEGVSFEYLAAQMGTSRLYFNSHVFRGSFCSYSKLI